MQRGPRLKLILLGALALALSSCSLGVQDGVLDSFDAQGPIAADLAWLFWLVFWIAAVVFVLVQGGLAFTLFRFRDKKDDDSEPKQTEGNPVLEVVWTVIPVVILAAIAVLSFAQLGVEYFQEHQVRIFGLVIFLLACLGVVA